MSVNVAFSPRCWAYRQRRASFGSVVSIVRMRPKTGSPARKINLGSNGLHAHNGNDPTRWRGRCIFPDRPDQARHGRPHQGQRSLMALELGETCAAGFNRIRSFNRLHCFHRLIAVRDTSPRQRQGIAEMLSNDSANQHQGAPAATVADDPPQ